LCLVAFHDDVLEDIPSHPLWQTCYLGVRSLVERFSQDVLLKRYAGIVDLWRMVSKAKAIGRGGEQKQTDDRVLDIRRAMSKLRSAGTRRFLIFAGLALPMGLVAASPVRGRWIPGAEVIPIVQRYQLKETGYRKAEIGY